MRDKGNRVPRTGRRAGGIGLMVAVGLCGLLVAGISTLHAAEKTELLRYEVTWNGNKAGHGDITSKTDGKQVSVTCQAVSDGVLKTLVEIWSRVQATFTPATFRPQTYQFHLKSNLGKPEQVELAFDHKTQLVQVNKQKGSERESHSEQFTGVYDPITAVFLLRNQKDFSKPMFVDIYDGKDRSRLLVTPVGMESVKVKSGVHQAFCCALRLVKLSGDRKEIATGRLWISSDENRIPLLLTSNPLVGTIRFELVQAQL
jgi:hypothetical protein